MKLDRSIGAACLAALLTLGSAVAQDVLIRGARIIPVVGDEIAEGAILVRDGKIAEIGSRIAPPAGVPVVDAVGRTLMPGFVIAQTANGLDRPNEVVDSVPFVHARDALDPSRIFFEDSLRDGHLTILVIPGERTVIGGRGLVVHPRGLTVEQMTCLPEAGMKLSMIPMAGNRAVQIARLRAELGEAQRYRRDQERKAEEELKPSGNITLDLQRLGVEERRRPLLAMLGGELPAYIACGTAADVLQAGRLIEEFGLNARLVLGPGTWRAVPYLKDKSWPLILGPDLETRENDPETGKLITKNIARELHAAGLRFAVTNDPGSLGRRYMWYQAASLVRAGLPRAEALKSVTLHGAEAIGLKDKKGSLEVGKDADFIVLTDDPMSGKAWVDTAWVAGQMVYDRAKDPRISDLLGAGPR